MLARKIIFASYIFYYKYTVYSLKFTATSLNTYTYTTYIYIYKFIVSLFINLLYFEKYFKLCKSFKILNKKICIFVFRCKMMVNDATTVRKKSQLISSSPSSYSSSYVVFTKIPMNTQSIQIRAQESQEWFKYSSFPLYK